MRFSEEFRGSYLKAADLRGKTMRCTIDDIRREQIGEDQKIVLHFKERKQSFVLNKTNGSVLRDLFGDEMDEWIGQVILLRPDKTDFGGKRVDCVRVGAAPERIPQTDVESVEEDNLEV